MQNIKAILSNHNMNILHQKKQIKDDSDNSCNCPLCGECLLPNIVYQRKITSSQPNYVVKVYFGVEEKYFKDTTSPNHLPMRITQTTVKRILGN